MVVVLPAAVDLQRVVLKFLGPRMFPAARHSLVFDTKTAEAALYMFQTLMDADLKGLSYGVILWMHPDCKRYLDTEFRETKSHLTSRASLNLERELADLRVTRHVIISTGYNMYGTGMVIITG